MPYIFIDDGAPEASEYAENYIWCDAEAWPATVGEVAAMVEAVCAGRRGLVAGAQSPITMRAWRENASPLSGDGGST